MWFSGIRSENLKLYLRGVRIIEEKLKKRYRKVLVLGCFYWTVVELYRTYWQEEWERDVWVPRFVLNSRREHYINTEYNRLKLGVNTTFCITNWEAESKMVYHVDTQGNHRYEKIVIPPYHYGALGDVKAVERFYLSAVYRMNKDKRNDLDNFLRFKTVTLGDWLIGCYFVFNVKTKSFDPFFYKPEFMYWKDRENLFLNFQTSDKLRTILRVIDWAVEKIKKFEELANEVLY